MFLSKALTDLNLFRRGGNCLFPLYLYPVDEDALGLGAGERTPNLAPGFVAALAEATGLRFGSEGADGLDGSFGAEDVFRWVYAVLHSPQYRRRYAGFLRSDFPRVPLPRDRAQFEALTALGGRLAALHLLEADGPDADMPAFPVAGGDVVERVRYEEPRDGEPGRVRINAAQYFGGVAPETWAFAVGGYRPAEKWLRDRKGRTLTYDDIGRYRRMCAALAETPRLMARIDEAIAASGGWPLGG